MPSSNLAASIGRRDLVASRFGTRASCTKGSERMGRTHTVVAGETLSALALRYYGDAELYRLIATASGIADPNVINVGQRLIMPDFTRYTAVAGDTLSGLAVRFYGDAGLAWLIAG